MTALLIELIPSGEHLLLKESIVISVYKKAESNTREKSSKSENKHGKWRNVVLLTGRFFHKMFSVRPEFPRRLCRFVQQ